MMMARAKTGIDRVQTALRGEGLELWGGRRWERKRKKEEEEGKRIKEEEEGVVDT